MHVSKLSAQRFCSESCQHEWQKTRVGNLNPKYNHIEYICDWCGASFLDKLYKNNIQQHHFCCTECRQSWYANVWSQQPDWRNESRLRAAGMLANNAITQTRPQVIVNKLLEDLGIKYENEKQFGYYSVDNYLPSHNLIIEVMGDYWHCNRKIYDSIKYDVQKEAIRRDKSKHTYLKKYHNIEVLYVWESDINSNPDLVKALISQYVNSGGNIINYHSMNYIINDSGCLEAAPDIIIPFQDIEIDELNQYYNKSAS